MSGAGSAVRPVVVVGLTLVLAGLVAACASVRLQPEELTDAPIAFLHWADKAGENRRELFEKRGEAPPIPRDAMPEEILEAMVSRALLRGDELPQLKKKLDEKPGRLMLIWPQTGEMEPVPAAPANAVPLDWSPDGERLLIASAHRDEREQLYEYHRIRKDLRRVTMGSNEHTRGGYAADGTIVVQRIGPVRGERAPETSVHRLNAGGVAGPPLALGVPPGTVRVVSAGDRIVFEQIVRRARRDGPALLESFIAVQDLARGSEGKLLIRGREPAITPDGQWIVFASQSSAGYRLRRMRLDGTTRVPIGPGGTEERMPSVSPDGRFVAFVQQQYGRRRLSVRRFDGKDERVLVTSGWSEFPVWH